MFITRLAGGVSYETATLGASLDFLRATARGRVSHQRGPRGWRVETFVDGKHLYSALIMQHGIHAMRSAFVDPETGRHFWAYR